MKKVVVLLALMVLLATFTSAFADQAYFSLDDHSDAGKIRDVCILQDGMIVLGSNGVWSYQPKTGEMTELLNFNIDLLRNPIETNYRQLNHLFVLDDQIYVFSSSSFDFYRIEDHKALHCFENIQNTLLGYPDDEMASASFHDCIWSDGLYFLMDSTNFSLEGSERKLVFLDFANDSVVEISSVSVDYLYSVCDQGLLAGYQEENGEDQSLWLINTENGEVSLLNNSFYPANASGFILSVDGALYYSESGKIVKEKDGNLLTASYLPFQQIYPFSKAYMIGTYYALLQDSMLVIRNTENSESENLTLRILGSVSDQIMRDYCLINPHIGFQLDSRAEQFQGLQSALISGDTNVDLYVISSDDLFYDVLSKGYAEPLTASLILTNQASSLYPWARDILFRNGELYAIPINVLCDYWTVNKTKWHEMGFDSYPATYDDIFAYAETWEESLADSYPELCLFESADGIAGMIQSVIHQYLLEHENWENYVSFDTPEFRAIIQSIQTHQDIFTAQYDKMPLLMNYSQYLGSGYNDEDFVESILPPALSNLSNRVVGGSMELLVLNPKSEHQDEAIRFMEYYFTHLDALTSYHLDASKTTPMRQEGYETTIHSLEDQKAHLEQWIKESEDDTLTSELTKSLETVNRKIEIQNAVWLFSPEDIRIYGEIAEHITIPLRTIYPAQGNEVFDSIINHFAEGSISLDLFIQSLNEKSRMMYMESKE